MVENADRSRVATRLDRAEKFEIELARPDDEVTTHVDVRPVLDRKLAAFGCHASQVREDWSIAPREMLDAWMGRETFIRVEPPPLPGERETALRGVV